MGILDGIVEWLAEQVMNGMDLVTTSVLGALGCDMTVFLRYFPAAETMYKVFVALSISLILLNLVWQRFKNFGLGIGLEAEDPIKLCIRSVLFITLAYFSDCIVDTVLKNGGTPYQWIMTSELPALSFADFNSAMLAIIGGCGSSSSHVNSHGGGSKGAGSSFMGGGLVGVISHRVTNSAVKTSTSHADNAPNSHGSRGLGGLVAAASRGLEGICTARPLRAAVNLRIISSDRLLPGILPPLAPCAGKSGA